MARLQALLNRCWYGRAGLATLPLRLLLVPFSLLFRLLVALRRLAYRAGLLRVTRLPVPVIVVGNLTAGGAGKTPLTLALAAWLAEAGYRPGIVSRGYGGSARAPMPVRPDSDPRLVGDEPVLLARRAACPVWVGRRRAEAGRRLLAFHPEVDVLLTDDGLQHYGLARDLEIVVIDAWRGLGNGCLLPAGPLREPRARLRRATAVVFNGEPARAWRLPIPAFVMRLAGGRFRNLADEARTATAAELGGQPMHALAGIGNPQRFFEHLRALGLDVTPRAFADHHDYRVDDLPAGTVLMTEKDAVKCAPLARAAGRPDCWFLAVDAEVDAGLKDLILSRLDAKHGPQAA